MEKKTESREPEARDRDGLVDRARYESPVITSYSSEEIMEQAGPAHACSPAPCGIY